MRNNSATMRKFWQPTAKLVRLPYRKAGAATPPRKSLFLKGVESRPYL
jgi:hypothetical protein